MCAVDGEHLKLLLPKPTDPAWSLRRLAILGPLERIHETGEPCLSFGKISKLAERDPLEISALLLDRRQQISNDRHRNRRAHDCIECNANPQQQPSPC